MEHLIVLNENHVQCKHCPAKIKHCKNTLNYWTHLKQHNIFNKDANETAAQSNENSESLSNQVITSKILTNKKLSFSDYFSI